MSDAEAQQLLADARERARRILEQLRAEQTKFPSPPHQLTDAIAAAEQALAAIEAALQERS